MFRGAVFSGHGVVALLFAAVTKMSAYISKRHSIRLDDMSLLFADFRRI